MVSYFPIPPNIDIPEISDKILGSITFLNHPTNILKNKFKAKYRENVFLAVYRLEEKFWKLLNIYEVSPLEFVEINRTEFECKDDQMLVAMVKKSKSFESKCLILPIPDSLRLDHSPIAERVSFNFDLGKSRTSYQGEYPLKMAQSDKGNLWCFDKMKDNFNNNSSSYIIFMHLNIDSSKKDNINLNVVNSRTKNKKTIDAKKNSFSIFKCEDYQENNKCKDAYFIQSDVSLFLPMILSVDKKIKQLSIEHTTPPVEFFIGGNNKYQLVNMIKAKTN